MMADIKSSELNSTKWADIFKQFGNISDQLGDLTKWINVQSSGCMHIQSCRCIVIDIQPSQDSQSNKPIFTQVSGYETKWVFT